MSNIFGGMVKWRREMKTMDNVENGRMKFPPEINPATGRFEMVSGKEMIKQSVMLILKTSKGERLFNPSFGSSLKEYSFMDINRTQLNILEREIRDCLLSQEPLLENIITNCSYDYGSGTLEVTIAYRINGEEDTVTVPVYMEDMGENERKV